MPTRLPARTPLLSGGGVLVVLALAVLVSIDATDAIDRGLMDALLSGGRSGPLAILDPITELGSTGVVIGVAALALLVGVLVGPWRHGVIAAVVIGLTSLGVDIVKSVVARTRPEILEPVLVERGFSFPSGHATLSMTAYGILAVLVSRSRLPRAVRAVAGVLAAVVILLVGISRVWLGVHFPSDVLAGWIAGAVVVLLYADLTRGVSREPAAAAVDADPAAPRSDPPATR